MAALYDKIIIGAGIYGLYAGEYCGRNGEKILILEYDRQAFMRASYINQARVHMGYHYPRSYTTAKKSADYYDRFHRDYGFCIKDDFDKIYAVAQNFSWTDAKQFQKFCDDANIPCKPVDSLEYFKEHVIEGSFLSRESTYDAKILADNLLEKIAQHPQTEIIYGARIHTISQKEGNYILTLEDGSEFETPFVLNATYASVNQLIAGLGFEEIDIKYELCEVILCRVNDTLKNTGITVMDGPFFSLMPFGKTGLHSLTSVSSTPHKTSYAGLPTFDCQLRSNNTCSPQRLGNCNSCVAQPETSWPFMSGLAKKYLKDTIELEYVSSLFSVKPILKTSEVDDSRPTIIRKHTENPTFVSVLSGKINTVYDLNEIL